MKTLLYIVGNHAEHAMASSALLPAIWVVRRSGVSSKRSASESADPEGELEGERATRRRARFLDGGPSCAAVGAGLSGLRRAGWPSSRSAWISERMASSVLLPATRCRPTKWAKLKRSTSSSSGSRTCRPNKVKTRVLRNVFRYLPGWAR